MKLRAAPGSGGVAVRGYGGWEVKEFCCNRGGGYCLGPTYLHEECGFASAVLSEDDYAEFEDAVWDNEQQKACKVIDYRSFATALLPWEDD